MVAGLGTPALLDGSEPGVKIGRESSNGNLGGGGVVCKPIFVSNPNELS